MTDFGHGLIAPARLKIAGSVCLTTFFQDWTVTDASIISLVFAARSSTQNGFVTMDMFLPA